MASGFVRALVKRDLWRYFTNPTGYVFITLFIFISAVGAFWRDRFFQNNLANLDQLNDVFPYLLAFFIPALTMAVWSEERKQATDELLLTLPATTFQVVIGKYLAALGIYTASLVLSLSHIAVLYWLGKPDVGLMLGNYAGYWLLGAAMIAVGMLASLLTSNPTIAFVLGTLFSSALAFAGRASGWIAPVAVTGPFKDFAVGVVSLSGVLHFVSIAALALYLNVLVIDRRHWPRQAPGFPMWMHHALRAAALIVAAIALNAVIGRAGVRLDVTRERLHSISDETRRLITEIPESSPVRIHAYVSPEVPEQYVQTRENLLILLRKIDSIAGNKVEVAIEETEPFTTAAREAREKFGIVSKTVPTLTGGRAATSDIFLGVAFTSGARELVIPFLDRGLPAEYEIARSIRVVEQAKRKKIGVVDTAIRLFGGMDFQSMRNSTEWSVVSELKKQYDVVSIMPGNPITEEVDALLVVMPSSMTQEELNHVNEAIQAGKPALLLIDPLPLVNIGLSPADQAGNQTAKGDIRKFLANIGVEWNVSDIVWDSYNPHPDLAHLAQEIVFVGPGNKNPQTFNAGDAASAGLQEMVLLYPGHIDALMDSAYEFQPLVRSGLTSGVHPHSKIVQQSFFGPQINTKLEHKPDDKDRILAAHVRGKPKKGDDGKDLPAVNVIAIADVDFISEQFFRIRAEGIENLTFDNVTFFLNSIDQLAGDTSFIALRGKRVRHRTLERVEEQTRNFVKTRVADEGQAERDARTALDEAQKRLNEKVDAVRQRPDLDIQTKEIMARNLQEAENRRFEVLRTNIETEKESKVNASKERLESQIRQIQNNIKTYAVMLPPLPVFAIGVLIFVRRRKKEREGATAARRLREKP